jgi:RNA polymerase sigma factor (sigma-70 family)
MTDPHHDPTATDADALAHYAATRSPDALARVVGRHVHLAHATALRLLREPARADHATQAVFVLLARQAGRLRNRRSLVPWVFDAAHRAARAASRAAPPQPPSAGGTLYTAPTDWQSLAPLIDDAIADLPDDLRGAFLLKYVANLPLRTVADALGVSDQQAGQRIAAAVAKIRRWFETRNQFVLPDALVAAVQSRFVHAAPPAVAQNVLAAAMSAPAASPAGALADAVAGSIRRQRIVSLATMACIVLILSLGVLKLYGMVKDARLAAATQPAAATAPAAGGTAQQGGQGGDAAPAARDFPPVPDKALPVARPVKPLDPALTARFIQAIRQSEFEAVEAMLFDQPDLVNATDARSGRDAVQVAADLVMWRRQDATKIAHLLIDSGALTDVHTAARAGHRDHVVGMILRDRRRLDLKDAAGLTPLQRAALVPGASPECEEVAELLMQVGAKIDVWTASTFGRPDDVKAALDADPSLVNQPLLGATPLNWAARPRRYSNDPLAVPRLLIDRGADVRSRDTATDGMTPLHHAAAWGGQEAVAAFLLEKGADLNLADDFGWTPLDYAVDRGKKEMVAFLEGRGAKRTTLDLPPNQPLKTPRFFAAVQFNDPDLAKRLLDDNPELATTRGPTGETPMHWAAANGSIPIIDYLLTDRGDVNAQETNKYGGTPLHWAVRHGHLDAAKHLLAKKADPKLPNLRTGQTLLHVAARHTDDQALIDLLLGLGIDPTVKDRFDKTALDYAIGANHTKIANRLNGAR